MKKTIILLCLLFAVFLLNACQTSELSTIPTVEPTPEVAIKAPVRAMPIDPTSYISEQGLSTQVSPVGNLLANPGFEFGSLDSWTGCEAGAIKLSSDAYEGSGALEVTKGNCFYQSVAINPDTELILSCYAKLLSGNGWTGMGLGFADSNWNTIGDGTSTVITGNSYQRYDVTATAPTNAKYASMWFYSDNPAVVDSCSLFPKVTPPPPPPPPPSANLLENAGFDIPASDWIGGCDGYADIIATSSYGILRSACLDQSLSASDISALKGQDFTFSCLVNNKGDYAAMSIFLDGTPTSVVIPHADGAAYQTVEIKGTAGNNISSGFVSLYGGNQLPLLVKECSLTVDSNQTQPAPEIKITNLGVDIIRSGDSTQIFLKVENTGNVAFRQLNVSSEGNVLDCGFNALDVAVEEFQLYKCQLPAVAFGDSKSYTINAIATVETSNGPLTVAESYTITHSNLGDDGNLLENDDFASLDANTKPNNWTKGCGGVWTSVLGIDRYGLLLREGVCVDQTLSNEDISKLAGKDYTFSCYIRKYDNRYASMSVFLDGQSESKVIPLNADFQLVEIKATAGQVSSGFVSIYAEAAIVVDDCSLTVDDDNVQPGTQQWFDRFGAPNLSENSFRATRETLKTVGLSNGAVYTVNSIIPSGNIDPNGQRVINIRKYSLDGELAFSKDEILSRPLTLNDSARMTVNILDATSDEAGNLYVLESAVQELSIARKNQLDLYIQKFNSSGDKLLEKQIFSEVYPIGEGVRGAPTFKDIAYGANALYVSGRTNVVDANGTAYTTVTKFDTSGNEQWVQRLSSTPFFRLEGLAANSSGDVYASAFTFNDSGTVEITKLNSNGTQLWQRSVNNVLSGTDLVADDSSVYILGSTKNVLVAAENDRSDGYIWKYDNAGNQVWTSQYATNLIDEISNGALYNGKLYVTGSSTTEVRDSSNFFVSDSAVGFIKQIDTESAAELWSTEIDVETDNIFVDIAVDSTGIYAGGFVAGLTERLNNDLETNSSDAFITKYSLP